jgi:ABC-type xylose transport system substrate-binding protein
MSEQDTVKLAQLLKSAMEEMNTPVAKERLVFNARYAFMQYTSFVNEGFTPAQALQLVIAKL